MRVGRFCFPISVLILAVVAILGAVAMLTAEAWIPTSEGFILITGWPARAAGLVLVAHVGAVLAIKAASDGAHSAISMRFVALALLTVAAGAAAAVGASIHLMT